MKYKLVNENFKSNYGQQLLESRGIENIDSFIMAPGDFLQSWEDLENIGEAIQLILQTVDSNFPYALIQDCDADGITSAAIIYQYIKFLNPKKEIRVYFHKGKQHGLSDLYKQILIDNEDYGPFDGILTPDSGTNDGQYAKEFSCPVIVMDHHLKEDSEESTNMIIVNNQTSPKYKNKNLSGAGVTWQVCRGLDHITGSNFADSLIDLTALSVIGDMMDVRNPENRYIIKTGLAKKEKNKFFQTLLDKQDYSMGSKINPITIAFYIVPLINAMIRVGTMEEKTRLFNAFIEPDKLVPCNKRGAKGTMEKVCIESARECTNAKTKQDNLKEQIVEQLEIKIHKHGLLENQILFVRLDEDDIFPSELNGLVAMVLAAKYKKPTILARLNDEGYARGSARGVSQSELASFKDYLNSTGFFEYTVG